jgi:outer membrane protein assembly factor BamC
VFISQKGLSEQLTGTNNESSQWVPRPNDPALEAEYLKRLMVTLERARPGVPDAQLADEANAKPVAGAAGAQSKDSAAAIAARNVALADQEADPAAAGAAAGGANGQYTPTELTLDEPYQQAWQRVGAALNRANFTVDSGDAAKGIYTLRYVDPRDLSSDEQGFWSQVFHGHKEKVAKQYRLNVRAVTENQTRVAIVDEKGQIENTRPAREIMSIVVSELH